MPSAFARAMIALAVGWLDPLSTEAANPSTVRSLPDRTSTSVTSGRPHVRVPVLSNAIVRMRPIVSKAAPPLIWRVPSSRLLSAGRSLALVVFEPRLHELVEFLHLFVGVGFWRAVFQPTEHVSFD